MQNKVRDFCRERDWDQFHSPKDLAIGLVTEASELLEIFRFQDVSHVEKIMRDPEVRQHIGEELADCLFFILRFADLNGFDLKDCFNEKLKKNAERYPVSEFKGSNKKSR